MAAVFEERSSGVFVVHGFATAHECAQWIAEAEHEGFASAPVTTARGAVHMPDVRNNARVMRDDRSLATELWHRLERLLPEYWSHREARVGGTYEACGLNERIRFYRYEPGERFAIHRDGVFARDDGSGERSMLTFLLYLNDGFEGGHTAILEPGQQSQVIEPIEGMLCCFEHRLLHEGTTLVDGRKYVLRSDVMYHPIE